MNVSRYRSGLAALMLAAVFGTFMVPAVAWAQDEGDTTTAAEEAPDLGVGYALNNSMLFITAILVMFMQAGFAMVEAGFNAAKNAVNILFKNLLDFCIGALLFFTMGFAMMYPTHYTGSENANADHPYFAFGGWGLNEYAVSPDRSVSKEVDWLFQCVFAATAATIVSGAVAGRIKVGAYMIYSAVITGFVYPISGYWKWGGGWLMQFGEKLPDGSWSMGFQDFAGSAVVHGVGGWAGLAGALILGPRIGRFVNGKSVPMPGHSLPLAALGVFILWFGWYGFNPGSQLAFYTTADSDAVMHIAVTTTLAAAAGGFFATIFSWMLFGRPDLSMGLNGVLAGLVGITANCDCMSDWMSIVVGGVAAALVIGAILLLDKLKIDDPVGAWPVHGVCGMWGCLAIGILPNTHLAAGETSFGIQLIGTLAICGWSFVTMLILFSILKALGYLRSTAEEETQGLDISEHGMQAYGLQPG